METDKEQLEAVFNELSRNCAALHGRLALVYKPNDLLSYRIAVNSLLQETRILIDKIPNVSEQLSTFK